MGLISRMKGFLRARRKSAETDAQDGEFGIILSLIVRDTPCAEAITPYLGIDIDALCSQSADARKYEIDLQPDTGGHDKGFWLLRVTEHGLCYNQDIGNKILDFFAALQLTPEKIQWLKQAGDCVLRVYFNSLFASVESGISSEAIEALAKYQLPLEIGVFSWGGVPNDKT